MTVETEGTGKWIKKIPAEHWCHAPQYTQHSNFGPGSIWECGTCGRQWELETNGVWGPGPTGR